MPIDPASRALGVAAQDVMPAQVFQVAACNWDCWYCFVPHELRIGDPARATWLDSGDLLDLYLSESERPQIIDLSGGQPDLVPEWVPWMMEELLARGLEQDVYLWSDDNLSTDHFWRMLTDDQVGLIEKYPSYGRVGCFKGFDGASFSFNSGADTELYDRQFDLFGRLLQLNIDLYAYVTFTTPTVARLGDAMGRFVDRLQSLDENLPLRTVPLEIRVYAPVQANLSAGRKSALEHQFAAAEAWVEELRARYSSSDLSRNIASVPLRQC